MKEKADTINIWYQYTLGVWCVCVIVVVSPGVLLRRKHQCNTLEQALKFAADNFEGA